MEVMENQKSLPFSIDSILSKKDTCSGTVRKYSPYEDDKRVTPDACYGTEALYARLNQTLSSELYDVCFYSCQCQFY